MREYQLKDPLHPNGGPLIRVKREKDCLFCAHCTDVFWDYMHGIYGIWCEGEHDINHNDNCPYFEEEVEE